MHAIRCLQCWSTARFVNRFKILLFIPRAMFCLSTNNKHCAVCIVIASIVSPRWFNKYHFVRVYFGSDHQVPFLQDPRGLMSIPTLSPASFYGLQTGPASQSDLSKRGKDSNGRNAQPTTCEPVRR